MNFMVIAFNKSTITSKFPAVSTLYKLIFRWIAYIAERIKFTFTHILILI